MRLDEAVETLRNYHQKFDGDTHELCAICEGLCERHLISCLIPGEVEVIAAYLNMPPQDFVKRYTDSITTNQGEVVVLRLCSKCSFIDDECRCTIKAVKPIMCDIYPVYARVDAEGKVGYGLDPGCPLTHYPPAAQSFRDKCIPALQSLAVDVATFAAIEEFDCRMYDFDKFDALREHPQQRIIHSLRDVTARATDRSPGQLASLFSAELNANPKDLPPTAEAGGLAGLVSLLAQIDRGSGLWQQIDRQVWSLKGGIIATEDVEYLTALQHLATLKPLGASQAGQMHWAAARAALCRIPEKQRGQRLYKWIEKQLSQPD